MLHDESGYSEPFAFKPKRFFDKNEELNDDDRILGYRFGGTFLLLPFKSILTITEFVFDSTLQAQLSVLIIFSRSASLTLGSCRWSFHHLCQILYFRRKGQDGGENVVEERQRTKKKVGEGYTMPDKN